MSSAAQAPRWFPNALNCMPRRSFHTVANPLDNYRLHVESVLEAKKHQVSCFLCVLLPFSPAIPHLSHIRRHTVHREHVEEYSNGQASSRVHRQ